MLWYDEQAKALFKRETKGELRLHGHVSLLPYPLFSLMVINSLTSSTYLFAWISPTHPPSLPITKTKPTIFKRAAPPPSFIGSSFGATWSDLTPEICRSSNALIFSNNSLKIYSIFFSTVGQDTFGSNTKLLTFHRYVIFLFCSILI